MVPARGPGEVQRDGQRKQRGGEPLEHQHLALEQHDQPPHQGGLWLVETGHVTTAVTADWLQMTVRGAVWYQGESNTGHHRDIYDCTFAQLISSWRAQWHAATHGEL